MAYAVLSEFSRSATPKTNVETDLALFLPDSALRARRAPRGSGQRWRGYRPGLASPESTSRRTHLTPPRGRGRDARRPRWQWAIRGRMPRRSAGARKFQHSDKNIWSTQSTASGRINSASVTFVG